jgi:hypothetical protein
MLVALPLVLELTLRGIGLGSFPLYEPVVHGAYRMRPDQAGQFLRRYDWRYDANGQRNDHIPASFAETTLLVGDSVVDGGVLVDQQETLAAAAMRLSGESHYCIACHGWSLANSLEALMAVPGWSGAKRLVFVLNSGDFDNVGYMANELSFPTRRPVWLTAWWVRRKLFRRFQRHMNLPGKAQAIAAYVGGDGEWNTVVIDRFRELLAEYPGAVYLVRYPMRDEGHMSHPFFDALATLDPRIRVLDVADATGWSEACYGDHMHPNGHGLDILARHLHGALR